MSHAYGQVRFLSDDHVLHFEYNGTADVCRPTLYDSPQEVWAHWRDDSWNECSCGEDEPVEVANDYGNGTYWLGRACRRCRAIIPPLAFDDIEPAGYQHSLPTWWQGERT